MQQVSINETDPLAEIPNLDHRLSAAFQPNPLVAFRDVMLTEA